MMWKMWFTNIRKPFVKSPSPHKQKRQESLSTFYVDNNNSSSSMNYESDQEDSGSWLMSKNNTLQVPKLLTSSSLDRCSSEIDLIRTTALASIDKANSMNNLKIKVDDISSMNCTTKTTTRKTSSDEIGITTTQQFQRHTRSKSTGGLNVDVFGSSFPSIVVVVEQFPAACSNMENKFFETASAAGKSNTFPKSTPPVLHKKSAGKYKLLKKSLTSTLSAPVRHLAGITPSSFGITSMQTSVLSRSKDLNMKTGDKIGKGLNKIKHGVLGKSMEGIIDPADPAFDIADMCDEESLMDQTLTMTSGKSLGSILEYRDLSAWRISISRVAPHCDALGKKFFVFVIDVQRIDITSAQENAEDLHWTVLRRYSEFYTLESKLTEFHGPFEDLHLPAKANFFIGKGLDVLQTKIKPFEEYLTGLLKKPFLRESDILFTFLTSPEEFTLASSTFGVGKMINKVPIKLTKERGQSLQPFIDNFVQSTQSPPSKPRYDSVIGAHAEHDEYSARVIEPHKLFINNFDLHVQPKHGPVFATVEKFKTRQDKGVFDVILYLAANLFHVSSVCLHFLHGFGILIRNSFDYLVEYGIRSKLASVLCCNRVAYLIQLTQNALFDEAVAGGSDHHSDKARKKEQALENFQNYLRPFLQVFTGKTNYEDGTQFVFDALQDPFLNKQLTYVLVDILVEELFPELALPAQRRQS